jgi:hypothetical protein
VRVFVILYEVALMGMRVCVGLPVMAVFVLVLNMVMIMQDVRVRMRHVLVGVLVSVLRGHSCPLSGRLAVSIRRGFPTAMRIDRASFTDITRLACAGNSSLPRH